MSKDKKFSCPGVPLSQIVLEHHFPVLEHPFPILEQRFSVRPFLLCPVLSVSLYRILAVPARPEF